VNSIAFGNSAVQPSGGVCYAGLSQFLGDPFSGGTVVVTYSAFPEGNGQNGNINLDPQFILPQVGDFNLSGSSPCIDSGSPELPLDPDGTRADMGALSFFQLPTSYCVAKMNSRNCLPQVNYIGVPSRSGNDQFFVTASNVLNNVPGLMIWGSVPASTPFMGGTLCVGAPIIRTPVQWSGGSLQALDCTGSFSFHFSHSYMAQQFINPGQVVRCQFWSRDSGFLPPNNASLTNALRFTIGP
jgi:hypothetical protein